MIRLGLLRHGPTEWNRSGRIQGRSDIPLDTDARTELAALSIPTPWDQAALVSSPLQRAIETARIVGNKEPLATPALTEMDWGDWEGLQGEYLLADPDHDFRHIENWGWGYTPPNGESVEELRNRLLPWITNLGTDTLAVCHIGVMRVILAVAHSWDFAGPAPFRIKRRRIYGLTITENGLHADAEQTRLIRRKLP